MAVAVGKKVPAFSAAITGSDVKWKLADAAGEKLVSGASRLPSIASAIARMAGPTQLTDVFK